MCAYSEGISAVKRLEMRACGASAGDTSIWVIAGTTRREGRRNDIAFHNKKPVKVRPMGEKIEKARLRLHDVGYQ